MLTRIVKFIPAFDEREKGYGIHGVDIVFVVKGEEGAVDFVLSTNWQLPHVQAAENAKPLNKFPYMFHLPLPSWIGAHSPKPLYEEHTVGCDKCGYLDDKPCYSSGSVTNSTDYFNVLVVEGDEALWKKLEHYYNETFLKEQKDA